jgi:creatinine amidohydrolase
MKSKQLPWLGVLLLAFVFGASAQSSGTVFLDELTWPELRALIGGGKTTIIVPIGGTEQNGPHMVLGKHNVRVKVLSEKIARALGNALVAPVIAYVPEGSISPPTAHMRFPGTITVSNATFEQVLESAARSFKVHGFRDVVFLGDHGGYQSSEKVVADRLDREWRNTPVRVHVVPEYYEAAESSFAKQLRGRGFTDAEIGTHAGLADTSLALAIDPHLVRTEKLPARPDATLGTYGDPRQSSAILGQLGIDMIVAQTVAAINAATARR